ncbi:MAG: pyruvate kinase [bacterium]
MKNEKKTKIVCTIGPATWDQQVMKEMIENGMNCARTNGAFADPAELDRVKTLVRNVSPDVNLMVDVKGPEVRMNKFGENKAINPGDEIIIGNDASSEIYPGNYPNLYQQLKPGQRVIIGDGDVELKIKEIKNDKMYCEVIIGKVFKPGKAMNLPGAEYASEILTEKDKINLNHAVKTDWDSISVSFIKDAAAAKHVKEYVNNPQIQIIAKIEDQAGLDNIEEILEVVDGIMIARGGLGVELGLERVPIAQRYLIEKSKKFAKPVITATQMLESMIENPFPTRAEVNDVATAILLGTDAIMLSGESASGKYPVDAVKTMTRIALENEKFVEIAADLENIEKENDPVSVAMVKAAYQLVRDLDIKKIIVLTKNGFLARLLSKLSIKAPITALVDDPKLKNHLNISKNIEARQFDSTYYDRDEAVNGTVKYILDQKIASPTEKVLVMGNIEKNTKVSPHFFEYIDLAKFN